MQQDGAFVRAVGNCSFLGYLGDAQHREPPSVISSSHWGKFVEVIFIDVLLVDFFGSCNFRLTYPASPRKITGKKKEDDGGGGGGGKP